MKNMKTAMKLAVSFAIMIVLAVAVGAVGIVGMNTINNADDTLYNVNVVAISEMGEIRDELQRQRVLMRDISLHAGNAQKIQEFEQELKASEDAMEEFIATYETTITDEAAEAVYFAALNKYRNEYYNFKQNLIAASHISLEEANRLLYDNSSASMINDMVRGFTTVMENNNAWAKEQVDANTKLFHRMTIIEAVVLAVSVAIAVFLIFYISNLIGKPLITLTEFMKKAGNAGDITLKPEDMENISRFAQAKDEIGQCIGATANFVKHLAVISEELETIADNDLTVSIETLSEKDTMGISMQRMVDNLNSMFAEINVSTVQVSTGSKQIADGAQSLAQGSTEQAATVEELSSAIAEIARKTKDNAEKAGRASALADTIKQNAETGAQQMDQMMDAVREINQASQSISKVIKVIDDIAFQTNILALNAAVEAARAGQHGKGFAVVAEEVRNLAAKSAEAAKDTGELIANSMQKAEFGSRIADETAKSLNDIVVGINESTELVGEIARSSEDQSSSIMEINQGIDQVSQVIQQNSATAEESAAASEEMNGQANMLEQLISQFKLKSNTTGTGLRQVSPIREKAQKVRDVQNPQQRFSLSSENMNMGAEFSDKY